MRAAGAIACQVWRELYRRKDIYVLFILLGALLLTLVSGDIFGVAGAGRYVLEAGLLLAWAFSLILLIATTARQLPTEEERGTIYPLLAKPLTRAEYLLGKWFGCWAAIWAATALFYLLSAGVVWGQGGAVGLPELLQAFLLHGLLLAWLGAATLALSTRCSTAATMALAWIGLAVSGLVAPAVPTVVAQAPAVSRELLLALYYALPHAALFDLRVRAVHQWGAAPAGAIALTAAYGLCWTLFFLLLAWLGYRRKRFKPTT
ncbi:MAG: ABC transporter permease [Candidatus Marinimicrobia bacterium]|nr:ABC transporter permease [Candidatus Neomarinimicrobiota bacterium]